MQPGLLQHSLPLLNTLRRPGLPGMQPGLLQLSFPLLTTLRCPGLPGMCSHCSNLSSLHSVFCLSKFTHACSLLTCLCSSVSTVLSVSDWSFSFAANTPMLFVASSKPSGSPSAVVVFLFVEILVHDQSLSFAAIFVVGPMSFVVSDWPRIHTGCMLAFNWKYFKISSML